MTAAEMTVESFIREAVPSRTLFGRQLFYVEATSANNSDTITVKQLTTVKGCALMGSDGTIAAVTLATNVITVTNGGTLAWSGLVWGV